MPAVESTMLPLGTPRPEFTLADVDGAHYSSTDFDGEPLLVAFVSNHCPFVVHIEKMFGEVAASHPSLATIAIVSNDFTTYPQDEPDGMRAQIERATWEFPYLIDDTQDVARAFTAACTPDFFLFDAAGQLAWRGAMDGSTPGNGVPVTGELLSDAMTRVGAGEQVPEPHRPSIGCSIKWRQG